MQHRTEPFEAALSLATRRLEHLTQSWTSLLTALLVALLSTLAIRSALSPAPPLPVPDLVKVASLARAFEPLLFYSEHGASQIADLQATSIAVWDLGESVRAANMTSAPLIARALDDLSASLNALALDLTRFFASVDGDVDGILIVMDWARRELAQLPSGPPSALGALGANTHALLTRLRILSPPSGSGSGGASTAVGRAAAAVFGPSAAQRAAATLQRTFYEFLGVLEEAVASELGHSAALFARYEAVDRQLLNVARAVVREADSQERLESELLGRLWTRVLGGNAAGLRKYERNRRLLASVREKTVRDKRALVEHNGRLVGLRAGLEGLRGRLVSPLVRKENGSVMAVGEQIRGLEGGLEFLRGAREGQRGRVLEGLYGMGRGGVGRIVRGEEGEEGWEIEGRRGR